MTFKTLRVILFSVFLLSIIVVSNFAQYKYIQFGLSKSATFFERETMLLPKPRIALVNPDIFGDEKIGIPKYAKALKNFNEYIKELEEARKKALGENPSPEAIKEWNQRCRFNFDDNNAATIQKDIFSKLSIYAEEKGFDLILDSSKVLPSELKNFQTQDVTKDFISYYNQLKP